MEKSIPLLIWLSVKQLKVWCNIFKWWWIKLKGIKTMQNYYQPFLIIYIYLLIVNDEVWNFILLIFVIFDLFNCLKFIIFWFIIYRFQLIK